MHRFMIRIWNVKSSHYVIVGELKEQNLDSVLSNKKTLISLYDGRNDNFMLIHIKARHSSKLIDCHKSYHKCEAK